MHGEMLWAILAGSWVAEVGRGRIGGDVMESAERMGSLRKTWEIHRSRRKRGVTHIPTIRAAVHIFSVSFQVFFIEYTYFKCYVTFSLNIILCHLPHYN